MKIQKSGRDEKVKKYLFYSSLTLLSFSYLIFYHFLQVEIFKEMVGLGDISDHGMF